MRQYPKQTCKSRMFSRQFDDARYILESIIVFAKDKKAAFYLLAVLSVSIAFLDMLSIGAMYPVMNDAISLANPTSAPTSMNSMVSDVYKFIGTQMNYSPLMTSSMILLLLTILSFLAKLLHLNFYQSFSADVSELNRGKMFKKINSAKYSHIIRQEQGKLIYGLAVAPDSIIGVVLTSIEVFTEVLKAMFLFLMLVYTTGSVVYVLVGFGIIYIIFYKKFILNYVKSTSKHLLFETEYQHNLLNEYINGFKILRIFSMEKFWKKNYLNSLHIASYTTKSLEVRRLLPSLLLMLFMGVTFSLSGIYISQYSESVGLTLAPLLGLLIIAGTRLNSSVSLIASHYSTIIKYLPKLKVCRSILSNTPQEEVIRNPITMERFKNEIVINNLSFSYPGNNKKILRAINLKISRGSKVAFVGRSGAGKSTVLNILLRLFKDYSGTVKIDNQDIREISLESYYSLLGYVPQDAFLFNDTVKNNVLFGSDATDEQVVEACRKANAHEFISQLSNGYETNVGDKGIALSGGQKQRISIARVLLKKPEILLFDEPTSALDNTSEAAIFDTIDNLPDEITVIIVAHRLSTVINSDTIYVFDDGNIIEHGTHQKLISSQGVYSKLYSKEGTQNTIHEN